MSAQQKKLVVVLGMHRSGTSAVARGLLPLKVSLGNRLMGAVEGINEKGFWEDVDITEFNDEILAALGSEWHSLAPLVSDDLVLLRKRGYLLRGVELLRQKIGNEPVYGFKDPRVARLLPFWAEVFAGCDVDVSYVIAIRNPMSVVRSLVKRDRFDPEKSYLLWLGHVVASLAGSARHRRVIIDYDCLMVDAGRELARVADCLGLALDQGELLEYCEDFIDKQLRHAVHTVNDLALDYACPPLVREVYATLLEAVNAKSDIESDVWQVRFSDWATEFDRCRVALALADKLYHAQQMTTAELGVRLDDVAVLKRAVAARDGEIASLGKMVAEYEVGVTGLKGQLAVCESAIADRDEWVAALSRDLDGSNDCIADREKRIVALENAYAIRDVQANELANTLAERDQQIAKIKVELASAERLIVEHASRVNALLNSHSWRMTAVFRWISGVLRSILMVNRIRMRLLGRRLLKSGLFDQEFYLREYPDVRAAQVSPLRHYLEYGWREGRDPSPLFSSERYLEKNPDVASAKINPLVHYVLYGRAERRAIYSRNEDCPAPPLRETLPSRMATALALAQQHPRLVGRLFESLRKRGVRATLATVALHVRRAQRRQVIDAARAPATGGTGEVPLSISADDFLIPLYLNPFRKDANAAQLVGIRTLVCAAVDGSEGLATIARALDRMPCDFDLVLVTGNKFLSGTLGDQIPRSARMQRVEIRPTAGEHAVIEAIVAGVASGEHEYDVVGCFDARDGVVSMAGPGNCAWGEMLTSTKGIAEIFNTILMGGRTVLPGVDWVQHLDRLALEDDAGGLGIPVMTVERLHRLEDYLQTGNAVWLAGSVVTSMLADRDAGEHDTAHARLAAAIRRCPGNTYVVFDAMTLPPGPAFESQINYEQSIRPDGVKILSFYLPQFHPIPENDEWHGKGFTEWHKVRAANPLFVGHYQQHVPHPDLGYYLLDSTAVLKQQAEMMKKAGVYGQVFYHYWFGGRLILEKAAQMLLADSTVDMPFCFCWANENWTRRWDGNEREVLLGQNYGEEDAAGFIRYLIPFFRDPRYIKVRGRPVVFIYRPSSVEGVDTYQATWARICRQEGLPEPYVIATLTRGATDPRDFGMDAGCERVLHDWTDGAVPDLADGLEAYRPIEGHILDYGAVARFYMNQSAEKDFVYMRTIVPIWDNTARYDSRAYVVHDSSPAKFQTWLELLVADAIKRLGQEERFIVINAWNEWAEGAHLEPDRRYGYAYLNSVGRALSGIPYGSREYLATTIPPSTTLKITLAPSLLRDLAGDGWARERFAKCLQESSVLGACELFADLSLRELAGCAADALKVAEPGRRYDYELRFCDFCLFEVDAIANMLRLAIANGGCSVTPTRVNDEHFSHAGQQQGVVATPGSHLCLIGQGSPVLKCCVDASIFISRVAPGGSELPVVSTILRFHKSGSLKLLSRALYSLAAQAGCRVRPILAVQDLSSDAIVALERLCSQIPWAAGCEPVITRFTSTESVRDLRSTMLNESLRSVRDRYAAFLDYDDVVFFDAYEWLVGRLKTTGKNAAFGIVYSTEFNPLENCIGTRSVVFDYGCDYRSFVGHNHAPIHSFMLDMSRIDVQAIKYFPDMKYMEDYFMTLQIFSEHETDWASLGERKFVGDYYHHVEGFCENTLALVDDAKRAALLSDGEYLECERRIKKLRSNLMLSD